MQEQVEEALYMQRMEPAIREYLTTMREDSFIDIKPGYVDSGASPNETKPIFSAYVPPAPKKKAKVERTRYREAHGPSGRSRRRMQGRRRLHRRRHRLRLDLLKPLRHLRLL